LCVIVLGCASRSTLYAQSDAAPPADTAPETYSRTIDAADCMARPTSCPKDDFGPLKGVTATYEACTDGSACGDMTMVFDGNGCLVALNNVQTYSPSFVACVEKTASATRWICAPGKSLQMFQGCP
jgi:hypothetical protein